MVSFTAISAMARRRAMPMLSRAQQKRGMALGGHHGPPPDWQGIDKVVRSYFPEDYQLAAAVLGAYAGIIVLFKLKNAIFGKPAEEVKPVTSSAAVPTDGIPSIESPAFEKFVESDAFVKLLENEDQLTKLAESL